MPRRSKKSDKYEMPKGHLVGTARRRGEAIMYDERKETWNLTFTPYAKSLIRDAAKLANCSPSEFLERLVRAELTKQKPSTQEET